MPTLLRVHQQVQHPHKKDSQDSGSGFRCLQLPASAFNLQIQEQNSRHAKPNLLQERMPEKVDTANRLRFRKTLNPKAPAQTP